MPDGVPEQVLDDPLDLRRIDFGRRRFCFDLDQAIVHLAARAHRGDDLLNELADVCHRERRPRDAVPEPVDVEQVGEQAVEPARLGAQVAVDPGAHVGRQGRTPLLEREREADDRRERCPQLVRDGREDRVAQLIDSVLLGHVLARAEHAGRLAAVVEDDVAATVQPAEAAVGEGGAVVEVEGATLRQRVRDGRADPLAIVGVHPAEDRVVRQLHRPGLEAVEAIELVRPMNPVGGDAPLPAAEMRDLLCLGEARPRADKPPLSRLPLGQHGAQDQRLIATPASRPSRIWTISVVLASSIGIVPAIPPATASAATTKLPTTAPSWRKREGRPDEEREEHVRIAPGAADRDGRGGGDEERQEHAGLQPPAATPELVEARRRQHEEERRHEEDSHRVAGPPEQPLRGVVVPRDVAGEPQRRDAVRRGDRRAQDCREDDEREHVPDAPERGPEADALQQCTGDDRLERVADADRSCLEQRRAARRVRDHGAERDGGPGDRGRRGRAPRAQSRRAPTRA